jgi:hypothetical protein
MVQVKRLVLSAQIEIEMPLDIVQNKQRLKAVQEGLKKALTSGLYDQGVEFRVTKTHFKIK